MSQVSITFASRRELWEFVLSFEDGSLSLELWNERTVAAVAMWYLSLHPVDEAVARLEAALRRNRRKFRPNETRASVLDLDLRLLWPRLAKYLIVASGPGLLAAANDLLSEGATV